MSLRILCPSTGRYSFDEASGIDRLSLTAATDIGEGQIFLVPIADDPEDPTKVRFLIDLATSTLPAIQRLTTGCRATACGPPLGTWFPGKPRKGLYKELLLPVAHQRHSDKQSEYKLYNLVVSNISVTTVAGVYSTTESHQFF